jgi:hypothetical protein
MINLASCSAGMTADERDMALPLSRQTDEQSLVPKESAAARS